MHQQHHIPDDHAAMTWRLVTPTCCRIKTWAPLRGRGSSPTRSSICDTQGDLLCATKTKQLSKRPGQAITLASLPNGKGPATDSDGATVGVTVAKVTVDVTGDLAVDVTDDVNAVVTADVTAVNNAINRTTI